MERKEQIAIVKVDGCTTNVVALYELNEMGVAKRKANALIKKGGDYQIRACAYNEVSGTYDFGTSFEKSPYGKDWVRFNNFRCQKAYKGMDVQVNIMTKSNISGHYEFGKIEDPETLSVRLDNGELIEWNDNPWAKGNDKEEYYHFVSDVYPVPETYRVDYYAEKEQNNHIFDRDLETTYFNSFNKAKEEYEAKRLTYEAKVGKVDCDKNCVIPAPNTLYGFVYQQFNGDIYLKERYEISAEHWGEQRI